ncbi:MAG: hypothetical protein KatS3mg096_486 [Candidatus Parcubacteria bacterium]|nr:MAG: hypothetical protein KatS3mg096_486 [Candidatus Parcubacteria bacterium]
MPKYKSISDQEKAELLEEFCEAISVLKNRQEIMHFITDLLTKQEVIMLAKRIKIAKLLLKGLSYREIEKVVKVSHGTIAKVAVWLYESGEGFRLIQERIKKEIKQPTILDYIEKDWRKIKRRMPSMFWPELLIEEIIKIMNKKQKKKLYQVLSKLDRKSKLYKKLSKLV